MKKLIEYLKTSTNELKLVTWPKQEELIQSTTIVVFFVLVCAIVLAISDFLLTRSYQWFLSLSV